MKRLRLSASALILSFSMALLTGCSSGPDRGTVSGKVTINSKPVTSGAIAFTAPDNTVSTANISKDGTYSTMVVVGDNKVTLQNSTYNPDAAPATDISKLPADPGKIAPAKAPEKQIPAKYAKPDNGLKITVKKGDNPFDIQLTP